MMISRIIFFLAGAIWPISCHAESNNYMIVHAVSRTLEVYNGDSFLLKSYSVGIGRRGIGKTEEGDCKTPVGMYCILWKASRYAADDGGFLIKDGSAYCRWDNAFIEESENDCFPIWSSDYGGDQAVFMCLDYPNLSDRAKGYTGGAIAIHAAFVGVGEESSAGCIRMIPLDARDLYNRVMQGATVLIKGD